MSICLSGCLYWTFSILDIPPFPKKASQSPRQTTLGNTSLQQIIKSALKMKTRTDFKQLQKQVTPKFQPKKTIVVPSTNRKRNQKSPSRYLTQGIYRHCKTVDSLCFSQPFVCPEHLFSFFQKESRDRTILDIKNSKYLRGTLPSNLCLPTSNALSSRPYYAVLAFDSANSRNSSKISRAIALQTRSYLGM